MGMRPTRLACLVVLAVLVLGALAPCPAYAGSCPAGGDHTYVGTVTTPHTDDADGVVTYVCRGCSDTYEAPLPRGHAWQLQLRSAATCEDAGTATYACVLCGAVEVREEGPALGHDWGSWVVDQARSCTSGGRRHRTCARDASHVQWRYQAALGHAWGSWELVRAPSGGVAGIERRTCAHDEAHVQTRTVAADGRDEAVSQGVAASEQSTRRDGADAPAADLSPSAPQKEDPQVDAAVEQGPAERAVPERGDPEAEGVEAPPAAPGLFNAFDVMAACIDFAMLAAFLVFAWPLLVQCDWIARHRRRALLGRTTEVDLTEGRGR